MKPDETQKKPGQRMQTGSNRVVTDIQRSQLYETPWNPIKPDQTRSNPIKPRKNGVQWGKPGRTELEGKDWLGGGVPEDARPPHLHKTVRHLHKMMRQRRVHQTVAWPLGVP